MSNKKVEEYIRKLQNGELSSDEDESDSDDLDYYPSRKALEAELEQDIDDGAEVDDFSHNISNRPSMSTEDVLIDNIDNIDPPLIHDDVSENSSFVAPSVRRISGPSYRRNLIWKKDSMNFNPDRLNFTANTAFDSQILEFRTPYDFFTYYFTQNFMEQIVSESIKYSIQKQPDKPENMTVDDLRKFLGVLIFMSVYNYPSVRSYWGKFGFTSIKEAITVNKFERIRKILHFNDNEKHLPVDDPNHDRLHKLRPVIEHFNDRFSSIPIDQRLSIDEQMCATKIGHFLKQYLPNKPHKWGFKLFMLCSLLGYAYRFLIYSGKADPDRLPGEPDLGPVAHTVITLARVIPRHQNHVVYFDNYYTSIPLMVYLAGEGIHTLGTIQRNRLGKECKLMTKEQLSKQSRGTFDENVTSVDGVDVTAVSWKDNKPVTLASTYVGAEPVGQIQRFDKKEKKRVSINCPNLIKEYNAHMGGVDLMDSYLGRYRINMKSRKWYMRIFYHLLDLAVINAWVLYKKVSIQKGENQKSIMKLADFRSELADTLCKFSPPPTRGRPATSVGDAPTAKKRKGVLCQQIPPRELRLDGVDHEQKRGDSRMRCMMPGCKLLSIIYCIKCKVYLCSKKSKDCFSLFHKSSDF